MQFADMSYEVEITENNQPSGAAEPLRQLGKYELIAMIGEGGMAEVYLARQRGLMNFEKIVVVKTIHQHLARKAKFINMLLDEARIAALLKHPSVVDIYDLGFADNTHFIAMEHLAGEPLLAVLRAGIKKKPLDIPSTARLIADVADGLHAAHELTDPSGKPMHLVHRDITPGNIVVLYTGQVKIVDFGIAKARGRLSEDTDADHFKGKLGYISPEQVKGESIDRRADIFSLGVVMWEALALRRLFRKETPAAAAEAILRKNIPPPSKFRSSVPPRLDSICLKAMARDLDERYATAEELHNDIERFLSAGSFRPHKATIRKYMQEVFADNKKTREDLLKRVAESTTSIQVALPDPDEVSGGKSKDDDLPSGPMFTGPVRIIDPATLGPATGSSRRMDSVTLEDRTPSGHGQLARSHTVSPFPAAGASPASKKKLWIGLGVGVSLLIVIAMAAGGDDGATKKKRSGPATAALVPDSEKPGQPEPPDAHAETVDAGAQPVDAAPVDAAPMMEFPPDPIAESDDPDPDDDGDDDDDDDGGDDDDGKKPDNGKKKPKKKPRGTAPELYNKGLKYFVAGRVSSARAMFKQALQVNARYAQAYRGLGMVYQRQGNKRKALTSFRKYLKLAPRAKDRKSIEKRIKTLGG